MLAEKKRDTNIGVGIGFVLQLAGNVLQARGARWPRPASCCSRRASDLHLGCMSYCEGKGHSKWLGLLGLLSIVGLLILVFLPDRHKGAV